MANESINLNLIPTGEMPVIHVSQFDNGRAFNVNLFKGSDEYTIPEGYTAELHCRKADRNIVTLATTSVLSNTLTFTTTTQLCACAGDNLCEVAIKDSEDYLVGSLNFILSVEKDPLQGGIDSTSEIHDLTDQIEDITTEIVGENYYTKTETDTLLDAKADASSVYTKTQTDNLLSAKANTADLATVATTGDYDDLLNKPAIPAAQVQSDYAQSDDTKVDYIKNKPDINGMIAAAIYDIMPESTVTGAVASFNTDFEKPLTALTVGNSATKIVHISGDDSLGNYFRGVFLGNYAFVDLGSLNWIQTALTPELNDVYVTGDLQGLAKYPVNNSTPLVAVCSNYQVVSINSIYSINISIAMNNGGNLYVRNDGAGGSPTGFLIYELAIPTTPTITDSQFEALCESFNIEGEIFILPVSTNPTTYNGDNNFFTDSGDLTVSYKESIQHYIDRKTGD